VIISKIAWLEWDHNRCAAPNTIQERLVAGGDNQQESTRANKNVAGAQMRFHWLMRWTDILFHCNGVPA